MFKKALPAFIAVAMLVVLAGCARNSCCGCDAPDPCEPCCAPCDPCAGAPPGIPDEAKAGEAWCRVLIPAKYEETETQVCCAPASCKREWIPPVYEEQERKVCCKPASCRTITTPAEYKTVTEKVEVCAARTVWKKIPCEDGELGEGEKQGDCWQLTEIPAQYREVCKRVLVKEATCRQETTPPEYRTVTEKVMVKPGEWKTTPIPAQYKTVKGRKLVEPCRWEWRRNNKCEVPEEAGGDGGGDADGAADAKADEKADGDGAAGAKDDLGAPPAGALNPVK